jgi:hypothetical protein
MFFVALASKISNPILLLKLLEIPVVGSIAITLALGGV